MLLCNAARSGGLGGGIAQHDGVDVPEAQLVGRKGFLAPCHVTQRTPAVRFEVVGRISAPKHRHPGAVGHDDVSSRNDGQVAVAATIAGQRPSKHEELRRGHRPAAAVAGVVFERDDRLPEHDALHRVGIVGRRAGDNEVALESDKLAVVFELSFVDHVPFEHHEGSGPHNERAVPAKQVEARIVREVDRRQSVHIDLHIPLALCLTLGIVGADCVVRHV
jgi:hypothetical protein